MTKLAKVLFAFIAILSLSHQQSFAQKDKGSTVKLTLSPEFKERMITPYVYRADTSVVYYLHNYRKGWYTPYIIATKKIGTKFKLKTLLKEAGTSKSDITYSFVYKGDLIIITQDFSRKEDLLTLFYTIISSDGKIKSPAKEFMKIASEREGRVDIDIEQHPSNFTLKSKVIIDRNDEEELIVANFSYDFKQESYFKFNNKDILQSKEGIMYPPLYGFSDSLYMVNIFEEDRKSRKLKPITSVYVYTKTGKKLFSQELNTDNIRLFSFKLLKVGKESRLVAYYSDDKSDGIDGSVTYIYDPKVNKFVVKESNKIPSTVKAEFLSKRSVRKEKGIGRFEYSDMDFTSNGDLYVINENSIAVTVTSTDPRTGRVTRTTVYYTGTDLLLEKFDSSGKLAYTGALETPQLSTGAAPRQVFKLMTQGKKAAVYFTSYSNYIPRSFKKKIKDFNKKKGHSIYLCEIKGANKNSWKQLNIPLDKGYYVDDVTYLSGSDKAFVILTKRRPKIMEFFMKRFYMKFKTKVGIAELKL
jgi:hypothetical protein